MVIQLPSFTGYSYPSPSVQSNFKPDMKETKGSDGFSRMYSPEDNDKKSETWLAQSSVYISVMQARQMQCFRAN